MSFNQTTDTQLTSTESEFSDSTRVNSQITFYTICNATYFPGLIGLINSLRLLGHNERLVVLDCGLSSEQKDLLRPHCELFELPSDIAQNPQQYKPFPYLLNPQGTIAIIDSDIIVTKSLEEILKTASQGKVCVFPDPESDRWFCEWQDLFKLSISPRHQTYVNSGFVVFSTLKQPDLLKRWWQSCELIFDRPTLQEGIESENPTSNGDQDPFNALLMSEFSQEILAIQPYAEEVFGDFTSVQIFDSKTLTCEYRSHAVTLLHACTRPKPWEPSARHTITQHNVYTHLLRRLTAEPDIAVKVPPKLLPTWLRPGLLGFLSFNGVMILNQVFLFMNRVRRKIKSIFHI